MHRHVAEIQQQPAGIKQGFTENQQPLTENQQAIPDNNTNSITNNISNKGAIGVQRLLKTQQKCQTCAGFSCGYCGHKPYLRRSANGKELYKCVEMSCCEKYKSNLN